MSTTFVEYMTQKSKLKMEVTGIERLVEYVKTFFILLYYCRKQNLGINVYFFIFR